MGAPSSALGLDAVSRNPSRGGVAAPDDRPTTHARDVTRGFLSYYIVLLSTHPSIKPMIHVGIRKNHRGGPWLRIPHPHVVSVG